MQGRGRLGRWRGGERSTKKKSFGVGCTPPQNFFSAEMKLCNIHIKNLMLSVSGIFKGSKNWQKVAEICYKLVHDRAGRGLALLLIWRHRLIYMVLTLCEHACKTVCDVKPGIDPCPSPARSWDKSISNFRLHCCWKKIQMLRKKVKLLLGQFQVCIFAETVFGVRCTLRSALSLQSYCRTMIRTEKEIASLSLSKAVLRGRM